LPFEFNLARQLHLWAKPTGDGRQAAFDALMTHQPFVVGAHEEAEVLVVPMTIMPDRVGFPVADMHESLAQA